MQCRGRISRFSEGQTMLLHRERLEPPCRRWVKGGTLTASPLARLVRFSPVATDLEARQRTPLGAISRHARASCHLVCAETLARFEPSVRFFEQASRSLAVRQMFLERERIPLAPLGRKKVAAIDVDGAGELVDRVEN